MSDQLSAATDATLTASRALLGVTARSVADALDEVTLPQFRVMVILSSEGRMRVGSLAERLDVVPSTFTRSLDRMVAGGWLSRNANPDNRREVLVDLTEQGHKLVQTVTTRRRNEIRTILKQMKPAQRELLISALHDFTRAAGEPSVTDLVILGI
ncbi:MarR family transcriptional regulator [Microlunatus elymi]|uniref:MarR family transcriptional regulator n=1 Tax=Microlunatus elymi TaxID=2596828 RepID=A0A516PW77_9ACTN|nr:MarR family transcriptional regulator [Microlunatus elymi]QDP95409.1 MarR family transcriptional regulator [Microlunatus elymi]